MLLVLTGDGAGPAGPAGETTTTAPTADTMETTTNEPDWRSVDYDPASPGEVTRLEGTTVDPVC